MPPEVILLYGIVLAILGFLLFHIKLSTVLSGSVMNFAGHCIESVDQLFCFLISLFSLLADVAFVPISLEFLIINTSNSCINYCN